MDSFAKSLMDKNKTSGSKIDMRQFLYLSSIALESYSDVLRETCELYGLDEVAVRNIYSITNRSIVFCMESPTLFVGKNRVENTRKSYTQEQLLGTTRQTFANTYHATIDATLARMYKNQGLKRAFKLGDKDKRPIVRFVYGSKKIRDISSLGDGKEYVRGISLSASFGANYADFIANTCNS